LREADIVATEIRILKYVYNFKLTRWRDSHVKLTDVRKERVERREQWVIEHVIEIGPDF
jgi:hypothetical protein